MVLIHSLFKDIALSAKPPSGPLCGLRILDLSTVIAGPYASTLLADMGAEVIKVEMPGRGDALRALAPHKDGVPLWWKVSNRNKQGITLDLHRPEARDVLARLLPDVDVVVENYRPGTLDKWGITKDWMHGLNPRLVILRVTGFGQTGPYRNRPGFARVFESMSGFTRMCGEEGGAPMHLGYPISDSIGGLFGALGILAELVRLKSDPDATGQEIDVSVTEAMLRTLDFLAIEHDQLGAVRFGSGNRSQYAAPGNVYQTRDGKWASIAASTQSIYERLCVALDLQELLADPRFIDNPSRVRHRDALDQRVSERIAAMPLSELQERLEQQQVASRPFTTHPTFLPIRIFRRARPLSRSTIPSWGRCACSVWCPVSKKRPAAYARPDRRWARTTTRCMRRWVSPKKMFKTCVAAA